MVMKERIQRPCSRQREVESGKKQEKWPEEERDRVKAFHKGEHNQSSKKYCCVGDRQRRGRD
jgi:hypothetical protein